VERPTDDPADLEFAAVAGSSHDAVVGVSLDCIITGWNAAAEALFGYTAEEAVGRHVSLIAPPGRELEMAGLLDRVRAGEIVDRVEAQRRRKDGRFVDVALTVVPVSVDGHVVGASTIAHDVTEERRARARQGLLAAIVNSSDDAIISKDLNGIVTSWNKGAERLLGYGEEEVVGRHVSLIAAPGREREMAEILARIRRGDRVEHYETQRRHKSGTIVDISLTVSPIYDDQGRILGASKIARDIGERRHNERRLKLLMSELDHRAKNMLAVAQAMLRLTRAETLSDFVAAVEGRLAALARVHTQVADNRWEGAELRSIAIGCLEAFGDREGRIVIDGIRVQLSPTAAQVVGVLLHELATNAAKHGSLSVQDGSVKLAWAVEPNGDLRLTWAERGGPPVEVPSRRSFGSRVIERNVPEQLGGTATLKWRPEGLQCEFVVPATYLIDAPIQPIRQAVA
jgi:PAS domain S-box-containing protein